MAGGKETPRQKMIGLMYLVLMALLALNVTKEVLDAFVAIEENVQKAALTQLQRGESSKSDLIEALSDSNVEKVKKVKYYLSVINKIDQVTAARIKEIDDLKLDLLKKSGEEVAVPKNKDNEAILWIPYSSKKPLKPARINLMAVQAKDQFDVPMHEIIGEDLANITGAGKQLWEHYNQYRNTICELVGTYSPPGGKTWVFKAHSINKFTDNFDLEKQLDNMMAKSKYNKPEDEGILKQIYMDLSKNERFDTEEVKNIHWIGKTFDHAPLVAAVASLTAMQQEILSARATAITHIKSRVSTGDYSFNKVMALAYGPQVANSGEEIEVGVMMAAFDSDNQPIVTGPGQITVDGGKGNIKVKVTNGNEMLLTGTVSIKKKTGETKTEKWSHTVKVMKPQGTISQPGLNVFYRNYENIIEGVASGYDQCILTPGAGSPQLIKNGTAYIVKPGAGRTCSIHISGKNSVTGKIVLLGTYDYRVMNMPKPTLYLGTLESAKYPAVTIKSMRALFVKYPPEILLNSKFDVGTWTMKLNGGKEIEGSGQGINDAAQNLLRQVKPGDQLTIFSKYKGPIGGFVSCTLTAE
jgi:hypothetical protein